MTTKSAKKSWSKRRSRYGKDGIADTRKDRIKAVKSALSGRVRTRPGFLGYVQGDQIKPLPEGFKGRERQWRRSVRQDFPKDGSKYEKWERVRVRVGKKTVDAFVPEWKVRNLKIPKGYVLTERQAKQLLAKLKI
jgi:hypothetical protein